MQRFNYPPRKPTRRATFNIVVLKSATHERVEGQFSGHAHDPPRVQGALADPADAARGPPEVRSRCRGWSLRFGLLHLLPARPHRTAATTASSAVDAGVLVGPESAGEALKDLLCGKALEAPRHQPTCRRAEPGVAAHLVKGSTDKDSRTIGNSTQQATESKQGE